MRVPERVQEPERVRGPEQVPERDAQVRAQGQDAQQVRKERAYRDGEAWVRVCKQAVRERARDGQERELP